jgi:hypothetical protein
MYLVRVRLYEEGKLLAHFKRRPVFRSSRRKGPALLMNEAVMLRSCVLGVGPDQIAPAYTTELARSEMRRSARLVLT